MTTDKTIDIHELSQSERILLAEQLWDSVAKNQDTLEVTDLQKKILGQRLAAYKENPDDCTTWSEVKTGL